MQGDLSFKNWLTILQDDGNSVLIAFKQRHCDDITFTQFSFIQAYVWNDQLLMLIQETLPLIDFILLDFVHVGIKV